jgi:Phage tail lysozyme
VNGGTGHRMVINMTKEYVLELSSKKQLAIRVYGLILLLLITMIAQILISPYANAWGCDEVGKSNRADFYARNNIGSYFDPCADNGGTSCTVGSGTLTGPAPTSLSGSSNAEKVWNYFIGRGLTPVAAAGAMGNIEQESGFDPLIQEGGSGIGFGLIQWSFDRRTKLEAAAAAQGVSFAPGANSDAALLFQLNWLWDGEYGSQQWQGPVNAETKVEGDPSIDYSADNTGNGSAMVFHKFVERSGDGTQGKQERIDGAKAFLQSFGNSGGAGTGCSIGQGGLTLEQAQKLMTYYRDTDGDALKLIFTGPDALCSGSTEREQLLANCVAFSMYFTNKFTSYKGVSTSGGNVVSRMTTDNAGGKTGTEPQPFSVFSRSSSDPNGHTGIILGIHDGKAVIGEAACGYGNAGIRAYEVSVDELKNDQRGYTYFYLGDKMKTDVLGGVVNG